MKKVFLCTLALGLLTLSFEVSAARVMLNGQRFIDPNYSRTLYHIIKKDTPEYDYAATGITALPKNIRPRYSRLKPVGDNIDYPKRRYQNILRPYYLKPKSDIRQTRPTATDSDKTNLWTARRKMMIRRNADAYSKLWR